MMQAEILSAIFLLLIYKFSQTFSLPDWHLSVANSRERIYAASVLQLLSVSAVTYDPYETTQLAFVLCSFI
jgi:hypothetical protein